MFFGDPALEKVVAVTHAAATVEPCGRQVSSQTRKRRNELECRSRRQRANCSIYQRIGFIFLQRLPVFRFDTRDKCIRIK